MTEPKRHYWQTREWQASVAADAAGMEQPVEALLRGQAALLLAVASLLPREERPELIHHANQHIELVKLLRAVKE
jgi:hypothetical protein